MLRPSRWVWMRSRAAAPRGSRWFVAGSELRESWRTALLDDRHGIPVVAVREGRIHAAMARRARFLRTFGWAEVLDLRSACRAPSWVADHSRSSASLSARG